MLPASFRAWGAFSVCNPCANLLHTARIFTAQLADNPQAVRGAKPLGE